MDAYERCSTHGLRKCAVCDRPAKPGAERIETTVFPPEMLDGPDDYANGNAEVVRVMPTIDPTVQVDDVQVPQPIIRYSPIVDAAAEYDKAQKYLETCLKTIQRLKSDLADAETMNAEAIADRDMKKQVLQKLVAE